MSGVCAVLSSFSYVRLFATPWTVAHQTPLSMGSSRQECWSVLPFPFPGDLPNPGIKPMSHVSPTLAGGFFSTEPPGKPMSRIRDPIQLQFSSVQFSSVLSLSHVLLFATPWNAACQSCLSITNSWGLLKLMSIQSVMPSNHLIFYHPLLLPSIFPSISVFSSESGFRIRWPKYWSFSFSISPSNEYSGLISFRMD